MPVRRDKNGYYYYEPGPEVQKFGPKVTRALTEQVNKNLPKMTLPPPTVDLGEGAPGDIDITSYDQQKNSVEGMKADERGLVERAEANDIDARDILVGTSDTSTMGRIFDVLSRPNYAVANLAAHLKGYGEDYTKADDPLEAVWEGLAGDAKNTFTRMYSEKVDPNAPAGSIRGSVGAPVVGLISDIVLDPTTYIGAGLARRGGQMLVGGEKAAEVVDTSSDLGRALDAVKPAFGSRVATAIKDAPGVRAAASSAGNDVGRMEAFRTALRSTKPSHAPIPTGATTPTGRTLIRTGDPKAMERILHSEPLLQKGSKAAVLRRSIGDDVEKTFTAVAKSQGIDTSTTAFKVAVGKARKHAVQTAVDTAQKRMDEAIESYRSIDKARETSIGLKFGGKTVATSRSAGRVADSMSRLWSKTGMGRLVRENFVPGASIGNEVIHKTQQVTSNVSSSQWEADIKRIKDIFDGRESGFARTTVKDRKSITEALESGSDRYLPPNLKPHYAEARRILDDAAAMKVGAGIMDPSKVVPNFVPHHYRNPKKLPVGMKRTNSLGDAARYGADPRMDVAELLSLHLADTYRAVGRQKMIDNFGDMFGIPKASGKTREGREIHRLLNKGELVKGEKIHPSLKGQVFDREIARSMERAITVFTKQDDATGFLRLYDSALGRVKFILTAPNPGFHLRNLLGDVFVNWLDDVSDPRFYAMAQRVLSNKSGQIVPSIKGFPALDGQDIKQWYDAMGLRSGFFHADVAGGESGSLVSRLKSTGVGEGVGRGGRRVSEGIKNASEYREDFARIAHFIAAYQDEATKGAKTVEEAMEAAAARVRRFNFDYQDLTTFERNTMRRFVPFYTYMRKSIPLQISMLFAKPGKVATVDKNMRALAAMMGTSDEEMQESLPGVGGVVPKWLSDMTKVELQDETADQDSIFWAPDLPIQQMNTFFGGFDEGVVPGVERFGRELTSGLTPLAKLPLEQFTGHDFATGAPVSDSWFDRAISLVPGARAAMGDRDKDALHQSPTYEIGGVEIDESLLNYLTGVGLRKVTPARQKSEIMRRDQPIKEALSKAKTDARIGYSQDGLPTPEEVLERYKELRKKGLL